MGRYRTLIVEDEAPWIEFFKRLAATPNFSHAEYDYRMNADSAKKALAARPVHVASLDQNIPVVPNELASADYGFDLLEEIVTSRPFVRALMYTGYGRVKFANLAGRLGETEYFEKKQAETEKDGMDVPDYFQLLKVLTLGGERPDTKKKEMGYVHWALGRARRHLPGMIGAACGQLHDAQLDSFDSAKAEKALATLIERATELAWAHACALAHDVGALPNTPLLAKDQGAMERVLCALWQAIDHAGALGNWRGYITESTTNREAKPAGGRFIEALGRLRAIRNRNVHGRAEALSPVDLVHAGDDLLALVDGLAFWADRPLMHGTRVHPDDRNRLQFQKIVATGPWPISDAKSNASPLTKIDRRRSIQALHCVGDQERLIDLFPFVSMLELPGKTPVPALLLPAANGRFIRRSLVTGEEIAGVPLRTEENDALRSVFRSEWGGGR